MTNTIPVKHDNATFLSLLHDMDNMAGNTMDVNIQSNGGYTPLHMAAINKSHKVPLAGL